MMTCPVRSAPFFLFLVFMAAIGCSAQETLPEHSFEVVSENGIPTALTRGGPRFTGELFTYEPILTIREDEEEPDSMMKEMVQPVYGPDGRYYFLDVNGGRIVVFDGEGAFAGTIGSPGEGPGELNFPFRLSFHGGTINVAHGMNPRLTIYAMDGTYLDQYASERPMGYQIVPLLDISSDGRLLLTHYPSERTEESISAAAAIEVMDTDGDTLASLQTDMAVLERIVPVDQGTGTRPTRMRLQYAAAPQAVYGPDHGIVLYDGREPVLECYSLEGDLVRRIRIAMDPTPVSREDQQAVFDAYDDYLAVLRRGREGPEGYVGTDRQIRMFEARRDQVQFAEFRSPWAAVRVDQAGWFWLQHTDHDPVDYEKERTYRFRLLDPEGVYIGDTTLPAGSMYTSAFHDRVIQQQEDPETGERTWLVYGISSGIPGFVYP